jgi:PAS domain S-box-containing protein
VSARGSATGRPVPHGSGALQRLGILDTAPEPDTDALVELVATTLGASCVALTFVDGPRAWSKATTAACGQAEVPRHRSLAADAVARAPEVVRTTIGADHELHDHPAFGRPGEGRGPIVEVVVTAVHGPDGEPVGALEVGFDAPPTHPALQVAVRAFADHAGRLFELRSDVAEYRRFVELSGDPVVVLDVDGAMELVNPALGRLLGTGDPDALLGRAFTDLVSREDRLRATSTLARVLFAGRDAQRFEVRLDRADGSTVTCEVVASHLGGARRQLQLVVHDLSARIQEEEGRALLSEQLARAQRLDAIGRLAGGLAHDLNNLLGVMVSNLGLAEESLEDLRARVGGPATVDLQRDLDELSLAVDRATDLTRRLLGFARRGAEAPARAALPEVLADVARLTRRSLATGVALEVAVQDGLPPAAVDASQLERVLVNLVINAGDAIAGRGRIRIDAEVVDPLAPLPADLGGVRLPSLDGRRLVRLDVVDDGAGMGPEVQARAFEPLFTTKGDRGSGLGLATVAAFVEEVDGAVTVASEPGRGTRVTLLLHAAEPIAPSLPGPAELPVAGARLLVVEPGERTRTVIATMLGGAGYRVREARTGEDALEQLAEHPVDLVLTEVALPGIGGARLLERLHQEHPDLPALALSSVDAPDTVSGVPTLIKPFSHARLLRTVAELLAP